eukprot:gene19560-23431_t
MSSMNVRRLLNTKEKRERPQPASVKKGFLERKKDYVLRAKDFNQKRDAIKKLKVQAALKNPDEFRFKMINSKLINGMNHEVSKTKINTTQNLDIKTQDMLYLQSKRIAEEKKIDRLQADLQYIDAGLAPSEQVIFLDDDKSVRNFNAVKHFDTIPEAFSSYSSSIPKLSKLKEGDIVLNPKTAPSQGALEAMVTTSYKELDQRKKRRDALYEAERTLDKQKTKLRNKDEKPIQVKVGKKKVDLKMKRKT